MEKFSQCPGCGRKAPDGLLSTHFKIFRCSKCLMHYCYSCRNSNNARKCPSCGARERIVVGECRKWMFKLDLDFPSRFIYLKIFTFTRNEQAWLIDISWRCWYWIKGRMSDYEISCSAICVCKHWKKVFCCLSAI